MDVEQPPKNIDHDLHSALKSCEEITSAQTLLNWIKDLEQSYGLSKRGSDTVNFNENFKKFAHKIVIATEKDYDTQELNSIARMPYSNEGDITEMLNHYLVELLSSPNPADREKLQCYGYQIKNGPNGKYPAPNTMSTQKQYFFKKEWEIVRNLIGNELFRHVYHKYLFFEKTSEGSLVQFGGK